MSTLFNPFLEYEEALKLIENKLDINEKNGLDNNATPIFYVEDIKIVQLYINHGADINHQNKYGATPLFYIDNIDILRLLITYGANVNQQNDYKLTPLFYFENTDIIQLLINHGAWLNTRANSGKTLLDNQRRGYNGTLSDWLDNVKLLIAHGATAGKIETYQEFREYFTVEQQEAFDMFLTLTSDDNIFFQMCVAFQEGIKNNVSVKIKDMDIV
jgi:hypothetical protein